MKDKFELIALILLLLGGIACGMFVFNANIVMSIAFQIGWIAKIIYGMIGLSAIYYGWKILPEVFK